ncbi:NADH-quinone oxidoreductase subunit G, partial [uncultured Actinomyces sp.]|uniref:NADH-quinone oxidoreductase subunit J family protein n=1 Tax=uncultured Actinomyces sp. TaxID=249061 RepID=UPI0025E080E5
GEPVSTAGSSAGRWVIALLGVGLVAVLAAVVWRSAIPSASGLQGGDAAVPSALAGVLFGDHVVTMELTGVLLVIAAVGALTLTHRQRIRPRMTQRDQVDARMRAYAEEGAHPGQKPMPGVYAATNAATAPALSADGDALVESVPRVLRVRDQGLDLSEASPEAGAAQRAGTIASREDATVGRSGMPAMPGAPAPDVVQPVTAPSPQEDAPGEDRSETDPAPAERGNGHSSKEEQK